MPRIPLNQITSLRMRRAAQVNDHWFAPRPAGADSQIRAVRSELALARRRPSGLQATDQTAPEWPLRVNNSAPSVGSQTLTSQSSPPVVRRRPSGDQAIA